MKMHKIHGGGASVHPLCWLLTDALWWLWKKNSIILLCLAQVNEKYNYYCILYDDDDDTVKLKTTQKEDRPPLHSHKNIYMWSFIRARSYQNVWHKCIRLIIKRLYFLKQTNKAFLHTSRNQDFTRLVYMRWWFCWGMRYFCALVYLCASNTSALSLFTI